MRRCHNELECEVRPPVSGSSTIGGLLLLASAGGVLLYLASRSGAVAAPSVSGAFASSAMPLGQGFTSPVFSIFNTPAASSDAGLDAGHPLYGGSGAGSYPLYDPSIHNASIETTDLMGAGYSNPVSTADLKGNLGGGFFDSVWSGLTGLFGGTAQAAPVGASMGMSFGGSTMPAVNSTDVDTLARTLWGEARNESQAGIEAVANVVVNRSRKSPKYNWPKGIAAVCRQPWQFSCWNANDPNLPKLKAVTTADAKFRTCLAIAQRAVAGTLADRTSNSDHYWADYIATPSWAVGKKPTVKIGRHIFLRLV